MSYKSLHDIVTGLLLQRGYSIHFYMDFLIYAIRCFEELHYDVLGNINTKIIEVNEFGEAELPEDFMDEVRLSVIVGQYTRQMVHGDVNRLPRVVDGVQESYPVIAGGYVDPHEVLYNDKGEFTGRMYGARNLPAESYKVVKERGIIQLDQRACVGEVHLEYITDGSSLNNATLVTPYAKSTVEAYILFKHKEHRRTYSPGEVQVAEREYEYQKRKLRGRMSNLTMADIKSMYYRNSTGAPR